MVGENDGFGRRCIRNRESNYHFGRSLANDEVCSKKTGVNAEK